MSHGNSAENLGSESKYRVDCPLEDLRVSATSGACGRRHRCADPWLAALRLPQSREATSSVEQAQQSVGNEARRLPCEVDDPAVGGDLSFVPAGLKEAKASSNDFNRSNCGTSEQSIASGWLFRDPTSVPLWRIGLAIFLAGVWVFWMYLHES